MKMKNSKDIIKEFIHRKRSLYERITKTFGKYFKISPWDDLKKEYKEAIDFCHLDTTPTGVFSFTVVMTVFTFFTLFFTVLFFHIISVPTIILLLFLTLSIFMYLYNYPFTLATSFRIKASSEMILSVVYMTIAMKVVPNIEYAVRFAASNLTGPLALDLKKVIWNVYTGKFVSVSNALDEFINKWKRESEEFTGAIYLIKTSFFESYGEREEVLNEAVSLILNGTKERMKHYAQELKTPLTILNALGILLPILGLIFFPMFSIFLPNLIQPGALIVGYDIILPISIYWFMNSYLERRPYSFHQPDVSKHPKFRKEKISKILIILSLILCLMLTVFGYYQTTLTNKTFNLIIYSLLITGSITICIVSYTFFSVVQKLKLRGEIAKIESELGVALFQLGMLLKRGMPIENTLMNLKPRIKDLKISKMFDHILYNMRNLGMGFEQAVFDKNNGVINFYPSKMISAVMKAIIEISKSGNVVLSHAMISISRYLKDMHTVEEELNDQLSDVTSTMRIQALMLAPLTAGIVVALTGIVSDILAVFRSAIDKIQSTLSSYGIFGDIGNGVFIQMINVNRLMPIHIFQLIVGIYMTEVVIMLAIFLSTIEHGGDELLKKYSIGKLLLLGTVIYTGVILLVYSSFISLMPIVELV